MTDTNWLIAKTKTRDHENKSYLGQVHEGPFTRVFSLFIFSRFFFFTGNQTKAYIDFPDTGTKPYSYALCAN